MTIELVRFCLAPFGTFGRLVLPSGLELWTVERPWLGNQAHVSCIPDGTYQCRPRRYFKGDYDAIGIYDVPDRDLILFHIANRPTDVEGCIGVGMRVGAVTPRGQSMAAPEWAVIASSQAFRHLMEEVGSQEFELVIRSGLRAQKSED